MVRARRLSISLPAVRFQIPLGGGFSKKYHVSPLSLLGHCFNVVSLGKALNHQKLHLTQVKMSTWKDKDGNVYDKFKALKWPQDCMFSVGSRWHTNEQVQ